MISVGCIRVNGNGADLCQRQLDSGSACTLRHTPPPEQPPPPVRPPQKNKTPDQCASEDVAEVLGLMSELVADPLFPDDKLAVKKGQVRARACSVWCAVACWSSSGVAHSSSRIMAYLPRTPQQVVQSLAHQNDVAASVARRWVGWDGLASTPTNMTPSS